MSDDGFPAINSKLPRPDYWERDGNYQSAQRMVAEQQERPVSSQLSRIEQDVKAALEGQARLNALVDGLAQQFAVSSLAERLRDNWCAEASRQLTAIDTVQDAIRFEADQWQKAHGLTVSALYGRLAAIEAKLESHTFSSHQSRKKDAR